MSFFLKWLKPDLKSRVGLRPHRKLTVEMTWDAAYVRALELLDSRLGANVTIDDRRGGFIEAGFGLINSERVRVTLERQSDLLTGVRIEAFYPAGATVPERSRYVDALADALESGVTP